MVAVPCAGTTTGVPLDSAAFVAGRYGSPVELVTVLSKPLVYAFATRWADPAGAPASVNGPISWTNVLQKPCATCSGSVSSTFAVEMVLPPCADFRSPKTSIPPPGELSSTCAGTVDAEDRSRCVVSGGTSQPGMLLRSSTLNGSGTV